MERNFSSDYQTPTMYATQTFDYILNQIQKSNLNFQLQLSPFSATISLKKSMVKNKSGCPIFPSESLSPAADIEALVSKIRRLEVDIANYRNDYENAVNDCEEAYKQIKCLESSKGELLEKNSNLELRVLEANAALQTKISEHANVIYDLKSEKCLDENAREASARINKELNDYKLKVSTEKAALLKVHKEEVKAWKKDLGEANKEKIKIQEKLEKKLIEEGAEKDAEIRKVSEEKKELEKKVNSLLDVLYGCEYCGTVSCEGECDDYKESIEKENAIHDDAGSETPEHSDLRHLFPPPDIETSKTSVTPQPSVPQPSGGSPPWTPPPTPPCSRCGGENIGPCPASVCFACIPPLQISPTSSSPSTTPPGTPPQLRRKHQSMFGNSQHTASSSNQLNPE